MINASGGGNAERIAASGALRDELESPTGNLLVIQEDNSAGSCNDGFCNLNQDAPDDDVHGGYHLFAFSQPETLFSVDIFDLDGGSQNEMAKIELFSDAAMTLLLWDLVVTHFGNNSAARVMFGNDGLGVSDVVVAKLSLTSSGAFSNLRGESTTVPEPGALALAMLALAAVRRRQLAPSRVHRA